MTTTHATRAEALDDTLSPLALKRVGIDTYRENVAYLHRDCDLYRAEGFQALEIRANGQRILASLNEVDDAAIVDCQQLGLSEDAYDALGVEGQPLYRVHAAYRNELSFALQSTERDTGIAIGRAEEITRLNVEF